MRFSREGLSVFPFMVAGIVLEATPLLSWGTVAAAALVAIGFSALDRWYVPAVMHRRIERADRMTRRMRGEE